MYKERCKVGIKLLADDPNTRLVIRASSWSELARAFIKMLASAAMLGGVDKRCRGTAAVFAPAVAFSSKYTQGRVPDDFCTLCDKGILSCYASDCRKKAKADVLVAVAHPRKIGRNTHPGCLTITPI